MLYLKFEHFISEYWFIGSCLVHNLSENTGKNAVTASKSLQMSSFVRPIKKTHKDIQFIITEVKWKQQILMIISWN